MNNLYAGNPLIDPLPPIPSPQDILKHLSYFPTIDKGVIELPFHERLHHVMAVRELHIPSRVGSRLSQSIDLMIRQRYASANPIDPKTWQSISHAGRQDGNPNPTNITASVNGHSGVGKSISTKRSLAYYPQVIEHSKFPMILGSHIQLVYLSVDVPSSGKAEHLAAALMQEFDRAIAKACPGITPRFSGELSATRRDGDRMLASFLQVAATHFLGILHLDEIQNLFKIPPLSRRRSSKQRFELTIIEDKTLKHILNLANSGNFALLMSGTPDGISALSNRFGTAQRSAAFGDHEMLRFENAQDRHYRDNFLPVLLRYQYVRTPLTEIDELAELLIDLTAGIKRLILMLWISAHRVSFLRGKDDLLLKDFVVAAKEDFKIIRPAIEALKSGDPRRMREYEDLMRER